MIQVFGLIFSLAINFSPEASLQNSEFLVQQLKNDSSDLRINALEKLGELKYAETIPAIADRASDPVPEVRFAAIRALAKFANQPALDALNSSFSSETDSYLKSEIRRSKKSIEDILKAEVDRQEKEAAKAARKK